MASSGQGSGVRGTLGPVCSFRASWPVSHWDSLLSSGARVNTRQTSFSWGRRWHSEALHTCVVTRSPVGRCAFSGAFILWVDGAWSGAQDPEASAGGSLSFVSLRRARGGQGGFGEEVMSAGTPGGDADLAEGRPQVVCLALGEFLKAGTSPRSPWFLPGVVTPMLLKSAGLTLGLATVWLSPCFPCPHGTHICPCMGTHSPGQGRAYA